MLKTSVKASKITNLTDARYYAAWEVSFIGFNLEEGNESYIAPLSVKAMKEWLEGPKFIGEFGSFPNVDEVVGLVEQLDLDGVQVGTLCSIDIIQAIHQKEIPIIKEVIWNEGSNWIDIKQKFEQEMPYIDCFLMDFSTNQHEISSFEHELKEISASFPILIDAQLKSSRINTFLDTVQPKGIAVKGGEEEKVGYKSFDEVDEIFEELEIFV